MIIDFYIYSTHEIIVWENIIRKLIEMGVSAKYVLEPPELNSAIGTISDKNNNWYDNKNGDYEKLMTEPIFQKSDSFIKSINLPIIYEGRYNADAVVTTQGYGWFEKYNSKLFRTMYGVGAVKNSYGHSAVNIGFDAIFAHGQFSKNEISKILNSNKIHLSGFPKWVKYFKNEINKSEVKAKFGITNNNPIIVYIPTWAQNSSLDKFATDILNISNEFNLLIKPHHNNLNFESERLDNILSKPNIKISSENNLMYYYAIADLIITDVRSGGFTEAMLVDCPIIGLSPNDEIKFDNLIDDVEKTATIIHNSGTNFNKVISKLLNSNSLNPYKNHFRDFFFENLKGNDDKITAEKMIEILDSNKKYQIPINLSNIDMNPIISVIIPTYNRRSILELTLDSLEKQNLDKKLYEVIVIDDGSTDDTISFLENYKTSMNFSYLSQNNSGPGAARNKGINLSKGKFVLFLNDDAVCNHDLLDVHLHFHKQFENLNQKIAVLGRFDYQKDDIDKMFMNMLHKSTLIFAYSEMKTNELYGWNYFWTCNISINKQAVIDAGMFDEQFREPMMEDVELGLRLHLHGYSIFFTEEAITTHIHTITLDSFVKRQEMLGRNTIKMLNKHSIEHYPDLQIFGIEKIDDEIIGELEMMVDKNVEYADNLLNKIKLFENIRHSKHPFINLNGEKKTFEEVQDMLFKLVNELNHYYYYKGLIEAYKNSNIKSNLVFEKHKNILFSVIIPTYNRAETLWKCLNSFCDQNFDFELFEIIIVDDGSSDETEKIVNEFNAPYDITYHKQDNAGPAKARNKAIELAKGEYLLFINDDTIAHQDLLNEHYKTHLNSKNFPPENQKISVLGSFDYVPEVKNKPFVNFLELTNWVFAYPMMKSEHFYPYRFFWTCNLSIKKSAVIEAGLFDEDFKEPMGEDTELGFRLEKLGYFVYYNKSAISWHDHAMNINDFTKRQILNGRTMILLFKKQPEILSREHSLFGFDKVDKKLIEEFNEFLIENKKECERSIALIEDIDKINIFNPNFIPINDNYIVNVNDIVKLIAQHIKIVHDYYFKLGIIEGYHKYSIEVKKEIPKPSKNINLVNSAIKAVNAISKKKLELIPIDEEEISTKEIEKSEIFNNENIFENKISELETEIQKATNSLFENDVEKYSVPIDFDEKSDVLDDDYDYLEILMDKPNNDFEQVELAEINTELEEMAIETFNESELIKSNFNKKVLFTMFGWNESGGGTMFPKQVALKYAEMGIEIVVFYAGLNHSTVATPYHFEKTIDGNVILYGIFNRTGHFLLGDYPEIEICDDRVLEYFKKVLDEEKPDIVHYHNFLGLSFKIAEEVKNRGIKSFYTPHNYHFIDPNLYMIKNNLKSWDNTNFFEHSDLPKSNPNKIKHYENRIAIARETINKNIDYTLAISNREKEILVDFGADAEKIFVVHQPPVISDLDYNKPISDEFVKLPIKFGYIGSVIPHKGVHKIVQAAQTLSKSDAEFHIYGLGNELYKKEMMRIDAKGLCVWHNEYKYEKLGEILCSLDCIIVPSIWEEAAGLVVLEAINFGIPVIGARIGGIPDFIIENVNGRTYPANSERNLAAILRELVNAPNMLDVYKINCKNLFKFSDYINHIIKLYTKAINNEVITNDETVFDYKREYLKS